MEGTPVGVEMGKSIRRLVFACVLLWAGLDGAPARALTEQEAMAHASKFADQVVRVIPQSIDGQPAPTGFGLIVGERANKIYIATPYHVAFGSDRPSSLGATPGIVFRTERYETVAARRMEVASGPDDLAVLEVVVPSGLALPRAPMVRADQLLRGTWVWNIGIGQDWDMPDRAGGLGPEDVVTLRRRIGQLRTPPGASGGAAVTEAGVIGIVLQDATDFSLLLPVERIVQLFAAWQLPVNLLAPRGAGTMPRPPVFSPTPRPPSAESPRPAGAESPRPAAIGLPRPPAVGSPPAPAPTLTPAAGSLPPNRSVVNHSSKPNNQQCRDLNERAALGEPLSDADYAILRNSCGH
jgi:hypothetical protein